MRIEDIWGVRIPQRAEKKRPWSTNAVYKMEYWLSPTFISLASGFIAAITAYIVLLAIKPLDLESDDEVSSSLSIFHMSAFNWELTFDICFTLSALAIAFSFKSHGVILLSMERNEIICLVLIPCRLFMCQDENKNETEDESFCSIWIKPVTNELGF